ncbi:aryl-sulfate sulfotransferase [Bacteroides sp. 519]|uniref:beta-propeller domain-containing protein n=1 Tax=Bacteroides sp. 519 TaxID=2302937 RepID=UPI0013D55080|nr:aryl-sulfate sulfotransferase [Bacteroides sp. 519]NDV57310.1 hypothetical protein [Bacteroides sp. 519]
MFRRISFFIGLQMCLLNLSAQLGTFAGCDYSQGIVFIMQDNKIVWQHEAPESNDIWMLPNGNILFTTGKGVLEMTRQNDTIFHYQSKSAIFACQRLANGNTFVGECNAGRLLEISPLGEIVKSISILPEGVSDGGFGFMRNARQLPNGNYLVAHYSNQVVKEYNAEGKEVWKVEVPGGPHSVIRLPNGNTLISVADMTQNPRIIELNKKGKCVWEFSNKDIPNAPLKFLGGMHCFPDKKILFTNWTGHGNVENKIHLFLINRKKKVLFTLKEHPQIQTMSSVYLMEKENK